MFAVVKTGGKQYKVTPGDILKVERLEGEAGDSIDLQSILLIQDNEKVLVGSPFLDKAQVRATLIEQARGDKIIVFKKKRRQGYRRKAGHRQDLSIIRIEEILLEGKTDSTVKKKTQESQPSIKEPNLQKEASKKVSKGEEATKQADKPQPLKEIEKKAVASPTVKSKSAAKKITSNEKASSTTKDKKKKA
jgi:large subunit ribosomal protein L21